MLLSGLFIYIYISLGFVAVCSLEVSLLMTRTLNHRSQVSLCGSYLLALSLLYVLAQTVCDCASETVALLCFLFPPQRN